MFRHISTCHYLLKHSPITETYVYYLYNDTSYLCDIKNHKNIKNK